MVNNKERASKLAPSLTVGELAGWLGGPFKAGIQASQTEALKEEARIVYIRRTRAVWRTNSLAARAGDKWRRFGAGA